MTTPGIRLLTGGDLRFPDGTELSGTYARALFVALLLAGGETVPREYLATLLWPDADSQAGRQRLRMALMKLRQQLASIPKPILHVTPDRLSIRTGRDDVDIVAFEDLARQDAAAARTAAIALYEGDLLARFPPVSDAFDAMLHLRRLDLRDTFERLCRSALSDHAAAGNAQGFDEVLRSALAVDPSNPEIVAAALRYFGEAGHARRVDEVFGRYARVLETELDAEPEPEIAALYDEMRNVAGKAREVEPAPLPTYAVAATADAAAQSVALGPKQGGRGRTAAAAAAIAAIGAIVAGYTSWVPTPAAKSVFLLLPVQGGAGPCAGNPAIGVFERVSQNALLGLKDAAVVLAGEAAALPAASDAAIMVERIVVCSQNSARGTMTLTRDGTREVLLVQRYDIDPASHAVLTERIAADVAAAMRR